MFRGAFLLVPVVGIMRFAEPPDSHWDSLLIAAAYGSLSMMTIGCRQAREVYDYVNNPDLSFEGRLERLKATVYLWQQISIYSMAAYMGFVAVALTVFWAANVEKLKTNPSLGWHFVCQMGIYSICVTIGPLHECFEMMFHTGRQLSEIQERPLLGLSYKAKGKEPFEDAKDMTSSRAVKRRARRRSKKL
jgi:hypothetical protein